MRKLIYILLFLPIIGFSQVPDTETFTLDTVRRIIKSSTDDLDSLFVLSNSVCFDPNYNNDEYAPDSSLLRFRNYTWGQIYTQAIKTANPNTTEYNYVKSWYPDYVRVGVMCHGIADSIKTFAEYGSGTIFYSNYYNFTYDSPHRSLWLGGVNIPQSGDTVTIRKNIVFNNIDTIYIGIFGDNYYEIWHNNVKIHQSKNILNTTNFTYLHLYKVTTNAGNNTFQFVGLGDGAVYQALGVIILDNTTDELFTNPIPKANWNLLWSTDEYIGTGTTYICQSGYSYDPDIELCTKILSIDNWVTGDYVLLSIGLDESVCSIITSWTLYFGDGTNQSGTTFIENISHYYSSSGTKTARYDMTLSNGAKARIYKTFTL